MRNDEKTFSSIVRTWQRPLYWYIRRMVLVHEDAEDILQETFARAFRNLWTLRDEGALKTWLFKIATNEVNRFFRKKKTLPSDDDISPGDIDIGDDEDDTEAIRDAERRLPSLIGRLGLLERQVFIMRYYEDLDYDQISRITGKNRNTLMVSYCNAKEKIKKELLR